MEALKNINKEIQIIDGRIKNAKEKNAHYTVKDLNKHRQKLMKKRKKILRDLGDCEATEEWSKECDEVINLAIDEINAHFNEETKGDLSDGKN